MNHSLSALALVLVGGMLLRMPIGFSMLAAGIGYLLATRQDLGLVAEQVSNGLYNSYVLLAVPLFVFAANLMNAGTVSERIFDFCRILVGRMRGGLAQVDILVSVIFSGMSGSAIADAAGPGSPGGRTAAERLGRGPVRMAVIGVRRAIGDVPLRADDSLDAVQVLADRAVDGHAHLACCPSFETRAGGALLRMR